MQLRHEQERGVRRSERGQRPVRRRHGRDGVLGEQGSSARVHQLRARAGEPPEGGRARALQGAQRAGDGHARSSADQGLSEPGHPAGRTRGLRGRPAARRQRVRPLGARRSRRSRPPSGLEGSSRTLRRDPTEPPAVGAGGSSAACSSGPAFVYWLVLFLRSGRADPRLQLLPAELRPVAWTTPSPWTTTSARSTRCS